MISPRKVADLFIYLAAFGLLAFGITLLAVLPIVGTELDAYLNASNHPCSAHAPLVTDSCVRYTNVTILSSSNTLQGFNVNPTVTILWSAVFPPVMTLGVNRPTKQYYHLYRGQSAVLKVWRGRATALTVTGSSLRLYENPYDNDSLRVAGGVSVLALGMVLGAVHPPGVIRRRMTHSSSEDQSRRWYYGSGLTAHVTADRAMRIALVVFTLSQLLDIVTSLKGGTVGLYEGNPVAAALIQRMGPVLAFLLLKSLAVIGILLVMARLPRKLALVVGWATSAVFVYVSLHNVGLILSSHPA